MPDVSVVAIIVAALAAFALGGVYYAALGERLAVVSELGTATTEPWTYAVEFLRCLVLAAVVAGISAWGAVDAWAGGALFGLVLWVGFPLVLWVGAVVHEKTPIAGAAIHAGDWLVKLVAIGTIVAAVQ